jgi:hypothetical protein
MGDLDVSNLLYFPKLIHCFVAVHRAFSQFRGSSTNELIEATAPHQIHKAGTARISRMRLCANHVSVSKRGVLRKASHLQHQIYGDTMTELLALSVSVAILGGIWAFIALGPLLGASLSFGLGSSQRAASLPRVVISKHLARQSSA